MKFKIYRDKSSLNDLKFKNGNLDYKKTGSVLNSTDSNENFTLPKTNEVDSNKKKSSPILFEIKF